MNKFLLVTGLILIFATDSVLAANYYRYKDENGVTVLGRTIPPHLVGNGYEVIGSNGRVLEKVAPALTPQEIKERDARIAAEQKRKEDEERQRKADEDLLRLYSHPNEAARIRDRKVQDLEAAIKLKQTKIASLESQIQENQSKAANFERGGKVIPEALVNSITLLKTEVGKIEMDIQLHEKDIISTKQTFVKTIQRLEHLTGKKDTITPAPEATPSGYKVPTP